MSFIIIIKILLIFTIISTLSSLQISKSENIRIGVD